MSRIKAAVLALNQTPLDWRGNAARIRTALKEARVQGAELVCLPELSITGYGCEDAFFAPEIWARAWQSLVDLLPETRGMVVAFGLPVTHQHALYNVAALAADGVLVGLATKQNLAGDGLHYEPRWFKPWPTGIVDVFHCPEGDAIPIGDLVFDLGGNRLGFEICEDAWVAGRPGSRLVARAVDVILNPSASHFAFGKAVVRRRFVAEGSRSFGVAYLYANLLGNESGRTIYDGQLLIAQRGEILAESARFSFQEVCLLVETIDLQAGRLVKSRLASHRPTLPAAADDGIVNCDFHWKSQPAEFRQTFIHSELSKEEEFTRAVALGLFDYLRKSRASGYVVSLSGGADSSAVACLVRIMRDLAIAELGENAGGKLPSIDMKELLLTAYQATENSGEVTLRAARTLADALGSTHYELDLSQIHGAYLDLVSQAQASPLDWNQHDIALQNIQARVRAPGIWMLANLRNALLLTTSNRSEAAVGYATMDGDTAGGLAPVSGIDKLFLRQWLRWLETTGPEIRGTRHPVPQLAVVNQQIPTAELRPQDAAQSDEDDLMPYEVLDFIERAAIRDHQGPASILELLEARFPDRTREDRLLWTRRFFTLWSRNQWKRERYAPGFHLDDENLDPKTWCRWPILSGGFADELKELES
ncbi:MAG: NAD(+) synthase [Akkermansiaceae bacterium]|jgi:NAD+ synthase (glutamine-hydrolysing)|nr:NAD(+) synthase [Akkermansiaceae bacterium]